MAMRSVGNPPDLATEDELTNPLDNALVADTGELPAGVYEMRITLGSSAAADFAVQRRNAANDANVGAVPIIKTPAGQSGQYLFTFKLETDERVRVTMDDALTGTASGTINWERLDA